MNNEKWMKIFACGENPPKLFIIHYSLFIFHSSLFRKEVSWKRASKSCWPSLVLRQAERRRCPSFWQSALAARSSPAIPCRSTAAWISAPPSPQSRKRQACRTIFWILPTPTPPSPAPNTSRRPPRSLTRSRQGEACPFFAAERGSILTPSCAEADLRRPKPTPPCARSCLPLPHGRATAPCTSVWRQSTPKAPPPFTKTTSSAWSARWRSTTPRASPRARPTAAPAFPSPPTAPP